MQRGKRSLLQDVVGNELIGLLSDYRNTNDAGPIISTVRLMGTTRKTSLLEGVVPNTLVVVGDLRLTDDLTIIGDLIVTGRITTVAKSDVQLCCNNLFVGMIQADKLSVLASGDVYSLYEHGELFKLKVVSARRVNLTGTVTLWRLYARDVFFKKGFSKNACVVVSKSFYVSELLFAESNVNVLSDVVVGGTINIAGDLFLDGSLNVGTNINVTGRLSVSLTDNNYILVGGDISVGLLDVDITDDFLINGGLTVHGSVCRLVAKTAIMGKLIAKGSVVGIKVGERLLVRGPIICWTLRVEGNVHCEHQITVCLNEPSNIVVEGNLLAEVVSSGDHKPHVTGTIVVKK